MSGRWVFSVRILSVFSVFSMVMQPVAWGQQQTNWASAALKSYVKENQKGNKSLTVKEFWDKNKGQLHPDWQRRLHPAMDMQKNDKMPQMQVIQIKGPQGSETARLVINQNGRTISLEYLGGQEKFVRINNIVISYEDFYYGKGMMTKLAQDPYFAAESNKLKQKALKQSLIPSYELFKKMNPRERAAYFVNMRLVMAAAQKVIEEKVKKEQASNEYKSPFIELLLDRAYADKVWLNQPCIVAGYVGVYIKDKTGTYCDHSSAVSKYAKLSAGEASQKKVATSVYDGSCSQGSLRCNPFIFGYDRGGGSLCIKVSRSRTSDFQKATSTCDSRSPLPINNKTELAKNTEAMINTLLKQEGKNSSEFFKDGKVISKDKYDELRNTVVRDFDTFIEEGIGICMGQGNIDVTRFGEKNQISACQTLYDRKLAFMEGFHLLEGKYETPVPTPAPPPAPVPPIAADPQPDKCDPANNQGKPCPPEQVPTPVALQNDCKDNPMMAEVYENGKQECIPTAARMDVERSPAGKKDKDDKGSSLWPIIGMGVAFVGIFALLKHAFKAGKQKGPIAAAPIAAPLLPAPPPQPGPVTPIPPISSTPIPPVLPPGASETSPTAVPYSPDSSGSSR